MQLKTIASIKQRIYEDPYNPHIFCGDLVQLWDELTPGERNFLTVVLMHLLAKVIEL